MGKVRSYECLFNEFTELVLDVDTAIIAVRLHVCSLGQGPVNSVCLLGTTFFCYRIFTDRRDVLTFLEDV